MNPFRDIPTLDTRHEEFENWKPGEEMGDGWEGRKGEGKKKLHSNLQGVFEES